MTRVRSPADQVRDALRAAGEAAHMRHGSPPYLGHHLFNAAALIDDETAAHLRRLIV